MLDDDMSVLKEAPLNFKPDEGADDVTNDHDLETNNIE